MTANEFKLKTRQSAENGIKSTNIQHFSWIGAPIFVFTLRQFSDDVLLAQCSFNAQCSNISVMIRWHADADAERTITFELVPTDWFRFVFQDYVKFSPNYSCMCEYWIRARCKCSTGSLKWWRSKASIRNLSIQWSFQQHKQ